MEKWTKSNKKIDEHSINIRNAAALKNDVEARKKIVRKARSIPHLDGTKLHAEWETLRKKH